MASIDHEKYKKLMIIAKLYTNMFSDDPSTRVGAIFVDDNYQILSIGCNHSPYSMKLNTKPERQRELLTNKQNNTGKKLKYPWIEHAERNAIFNAERNGTTLKNSTCITTLVPCVDCTRAILSVEVKQIYTFIPEGESKWVNDYAISKKLIDEANIPVNIITIKEEDLKTINIADMGWEPHKLSKGGRRNMTRKRKI
jgi:dCMP deaminase